MSFSIIRRDELARKLRQQNPWCNIMDVYTVVVVNKFTNFNSLKTSQSILKSTGLLMIV